ncbi:hypothetical protein, partial [Kingella kingae]|uniref:hypothetical protein n=1 Tax=Kingella kingae TaxID=504 RepID=UPI001E2D5DC1
LAISSALNGSVFVWAFSGCLKLVSVAWGECDLGLNFPDNGNYLAQGKSGSGILGTGFFCF